MQILKHFLKIIYKNIFLIKESILDSLIYYKYSVKRKDRRSINEGELMKSIHSIEKRISFGGKDAEFGKEKANVVLCYLEDNWNNVSFFVLSWGLGTLKQFGEKILQGEKQMDFNNRLKKLELKLPSSLNCQGGTILIENEDIAKKAKSDYKEFCYSRYSIRNFAGKADLNTIKSAMILSQKCPSTCNIQPVKGYLINNKREINYILSLQNGNRGFTEIVPQLIVLTTRLELYSEPRERNLCYVDGGIYALSLSNALHYYNIGSCILNWATNSINNSLLHSRLNIPINERVILLLAIGNIPKECEVPTSGRRSVDEIFHIIN